MGVDLGNFGMMISNLMKVQVRTVEKKHFFFLKLWNF
jgi:hypothetical protein